MIYLQTAKNALARILVLGDLMITHYYVFITHGPLQPAYLRISKTCFHNYIHFFLEQIQLLDLIAFVCEISLALNMNPNILRAVVDVDKLAQPTDKSIIRTKNLNKERATSIPDENQFADCELAFEE